MSLCLGSRRWIFPLPWSVEVAVDHLGTSCSMLFAGTGRCAPVVIEVYVPDWRGQTNLASPLILSGHRGGRSLQYLREALRERFRRCKHIQVAGELVDDRRRKRIRQRPPIPIESPEQRAVER